MRGCIITFSDRPTFDAAAPGLDIEDFEEAVVSNGAFTTFDAPLNALSSNGTFAAGDILAGLTISDNPGPDGGSLIGVGLGLFPAGTKAVLINTFADSGDLIFSPGVFAVGFDFASASAPGSLNADTFTITIYDTANVLIGTYNPPVAAGSYAFFGVTSDTAAIGRINVFSSINGAEVIDNIAFDSTGVPEPGTWSLLLGGLGFLGWRTRSRR